MKKTWLLALRSMIFPIAAMMILVFPAGAAAEMSARSLDALLQERAFRALAGRPKTGVPFAGKVTSDLAGIGVAALRLRSGSMKRKGFRNYNGFTIPIGVVVQPYVTRVVLVYQNLGNWSNVFYPLPEGYTHLTPVLGLLPYDASNLSASNLPELELRSSENPILIKFSIPNPAPTLTKCVFFDLHGSLEFDNIVDGNVCQGTKQGHFSIVAEFSPPPAGRENGTVKEGKKGIKKILSAILGTIFAGVLGLVLLILLLLCVRKYRRRRRLQRMQQ